MTTPYSTVLLGTIHVNVVRNDVVFSARVLIDPVSQATFISRKLQRKLDLPTLSAPSATFVGLNGAVAANYCTVCIASLGFSIDPTFSLTTKAYVVDKLTGRLSTCSLTKFVDFNTSELPLTDLKYAFIDFNMLLKI